MDIALHLGAHCTDEDRLLKTLQVNADILRQTGALVPPPGKSRPALRKALQTKGKDLLPGAASPLVAELTGGADARRLVLSYEGFLGTYATVLAGPAMYRDGPKRAAMLRDLFPGHQVSFFLAIRNPATFVPALFEASTVEDFGDFVAGHDLSAIRWSDVLRRLRDACADVPLTVWCNEDLPLIWPDILRLVSGHNGNLAGEDAILQEIMTPSGHTRLRTYLRDNPPGNLETWHKVVIAFLKKYADESKIEEEIQLPGWSDDLIAGLSDLYEKDVARIAAMDDITLIQP
ncbi:MAG: hypothetical protein AAF366_19990 [Pseudomonadota bacterium]